MDIRLKNSLSKNLIIIFLMTTISVITIYVANYFFIVYEKEITIPISMRTYKGGIASIGIETIVVMAFIIVLMLGLYFIYLTKSGDSQYFLVVYLNKSRIEIDVLILFFALKKIIEYITTPVYLEHTLFSATTIGVFVIFFMFYLGYGLLILKVVSHYEKDYSILYRRYIHYSLKNDFYQRIYQAKKFVIVLILLSVICGIVLVCNLNNTYAHISLEKGFFVVVYMILCILFLCVSELIKQIKIMNDTVGEIFTDLQMGELGKKKYKSNISETALLNQTMEYISAVGQISLENIEGQLKSERLKMEFITNVSHDLKTPLTSMIGYLELIKHTELGEDAKDYVNLLDKKQKQLARMIDDLLALSKASSGVETVALEKLEMNTLVNQIMIDMSEQFSERNLKPEIKLSEDKLLFKADVTKMYSIIQNLLENSVKYSLSGRRVFIKTYVEDDKACFEIKNISNYEIKVSVEELTDRFKRGEESRTTEGNGLGLAIVKSYVELLGGELSLDADGDVFKAIIRMPVCI